MSSSPSLVYPQIGSWTLSGSDIDEKPILTTPPPQRSESSLLDMLHRSTHQSPPPKQRSLTPVEPSSHYRPTPPKRRGSRKRQGSGHIPRPRNSFFIFRCEFTHQHAEESKGTDRSPTPEKTLSKRAGALWKQMNDSQKQVYRDLAKQESLAHSEKNPGYRYRPQRIRPPKRRNSGSVSRRERVESLVQMCESSAARLVDSASEYSAMDSPVSQTSSSPEPMGPITPREAQFHGLGHRRSMSLPHLDMMHSGSPYTYAHTYFIQPASCSSSPGPGPHRTERRSNSMSQRSYSPSMSSIPPPDAAFDLEYGNVTVPFASLAPHASTMSLPELLSLPNLTIHDDGSSTYSTPQISPAASMYDLSQPEYFSMQPAHPTPSAPLFQRRQRANTAPSAIISPLSMLSSTLGGYSQASSSASGASGAALTIKAPDTSLAVTPTRASVSAMTSGAYTYDQQVSHSVHASPASSLLVPESDVDFDRTPRRADFAANVQDIYAPSAFSTPAPMDFMSGATLAHGGGAAGDNFAMESYNEGLGAFDISPAAYDMSPFDDIDFSDFIHVSPPDVAPSSMYSA